MNELHAAAIDRWRGWRAPKSGRYRSATVEAAHFDADSLSASLPVRQSAAGAPAFKTNSKNTKQNMYISFTSIWHNPNISVYLDGALLPVVVVVVVQLQLAREFRNELGHCALIKTQTRNYRATETESATLHEFIIEGCVCNCYITIWTIWRSFAINFWSIFRWFSANFRSIFGQLNKRATTKPLKLNRQRRKKSAHNNNNNKNNNNSKKKPPTAK